MTDPRTTAEIADDLDALAGRMATDTEINVETAALLRAASARLRAMDAALKPFAEIANGYDPKQLCEGGTIATYPDDESIVLICGVDFDPDRLNAVLEGVTFDEITAGDLRAARTARGES